MYICLRQTEKIMAQRTKYISKLSHDSCFDEQLEDI